MLLLEAKENKIEFLCILNSFERNRTLKKIKEILILNIHYSY